MADAGDDDFTKELAEAFSADEPTEQPNTPEPTPPAPEAPKEEPKPNEPSKPEIPKEAEPAAPPADDEKKPEDNTPPAQAPETPPAEEQPKPLTEESIRSILSDMRTEERTSGQALESQTKEVMEAYYPEGLSNVLVDQNTGKQLKTPQDVVEASGGQMSMEDAAQWLMNEQYTLDQNIAKIKEDAKGIAENTLKFKQDTTDVLTRYEPLFKAYPQVQQKVWNQYNRLVKADLEKGVILSAPDMREYYDDFLEPYRLAFEYSQNQSATNQTPGTPAPTPTPSADDRLDEGGDGGASPVNDPDDFAQQVSKELAKGI